VTHLLREINRNTVLIKVLQTLKDKEQEVLGLGKTFSKLKTILNEMEKILDLSQKDII